MGGRGAIVKPIGLRRFTEEESEEESARVVNGLRSWSSKRDGRWKPLHGSILRRYKPVLGTRDVMDDVVTWFAAHRSLEDAVKPKGSTADRSFFARSSIAAERRVRQALTKNQSVLTLLSTMLDSRKKKENEKESDE